MPPTAVTCSSLATSVPEALVPRHPASAAPSGLPPGLGVPHELPDPPLLSELSSLSGRPVLSRCAAQAHPALRKRLTVPSIPETPLNTSSGTTFVLFLFQLKTDAADQLGSQTCPCAVQAQQPHKAFWHCIALRAAVVTFPPPSIMQV